MAAVPKVLCLGMSYADLEATTKGRWTGIAPTVSDVIEQVQAGNISQIDGRDLARCLATESHRGVQVYTASLETGGEYKHDRHLNCNFNSAAFADRVATKFLGSAIFQQVILDYYWMPKEWTNTRWRPSFFSTTLVLFVKRGLLDSPENGTAHQPSGVVYLPFCLHTFREVMANWTKLSTCYNLSFLHHSDDPTQSGLREIMLWSGTQEIDAEEMRKS